MPRERNEEGQRGSKEAEADGRQGQGHDPEAEAEEEDFTREVTTAQPLDAVGIPDLTGRVQLEASGE